ncbi:hypothetical protein BUALT_Bualt19G0053800 [Buddleja alternifolia]|uniref:Uncharacterized protein n=1 Tax=Buddleja alternifolia TaxID=168488 RepID=A0AAV6W1U5_9LAMI|nr:hypothetical protein BUALT_Bualt19G0053800 [Buddleja alternifolia]
MKYVYVLTGCEGSAADSKVLKDVVARPNDLKVPNGICVYTNGESFLAPYRRVRYHMQEWDACRIPPTNEKEFFNKTHAKALNVANKIVVACCLLQNYNRTEHVVDPVEAEVLETNELNDDLDVEYIDQVEPSQEWSNWRDTLAREMFDAWRGNR